LINGLISCSGGGGAAFVAAMTGGGLDSARHEMPAAPVEPGSKQAQTHDSRCDPYQGGNAQHAEHRSGAIVLDHPDLGMPALSRMVGQLFYGRIQQFDAQKGEQRSDHGDVPNPGWGDRDAKRQGDGKGDQFFTQGSFVA
jgi:hypothetical protein